MNNSKPVIKFNPIYFLYFFWVMNHALFIWALTLSSMGNYWLAGLGTGWLLHIFGQGLGLHRLFSHRSFKSSQFTEGAFCLLAILCQLGSPIAWTALHREHHQKSDGLDDPHSPKNSGFFSLWWGGYLLKKTISMRLAHDLLKSRMHLFVHRYYFHILLTIYAVVLLTYGWTILFFAICLPALVTYHITMIGAIMVHKIGYRNFETNDRSKNSILVSIITAGDGWHNNHHEHPKKSYHGVHFWEFDLQGLLIYFLFKRS